MIFLWRRRSCHPCPCNTYEYEKAKEKKFRNLPFIDSIWETRASKLWSISMPILTEYICDLKCSRIVRQHSQDIFKVFSLKASHLKGHRRATRSTTAQMNVSGESKTNRHAFNMMALLTMNLAPTCFFRKSPEALKHMSDQSMRRCNTQRTSPDGRAFLKRLFHPRPVFQIL